MTVNIAAKPTKVGEVAVHVQVVAYGGRLKTVTVVYWRFSQLPVHLGRTFPFLP